MLASASFNSIQCTGSVSRHNPGRTLPGHCTPSFSRYIFARVRKRNTLSQGIIQSNTTEIKQTLCSSGVGSCALGRRAAQIHWDSRKASPWSSFSSFIGASKAFSKASGTASGGGWTRHSQSRRKNSTRRHASAMSMLSGSTLPLAIAAVVGGTAAFAYWDARRISRKPEIIMQKTAFNEAVLSRYTELFPHCQAPLLRPRHAMVLDHILAPCTVPVRAWGG